MKYTTLDGSIIESNSTHSVEYSMPTNMPNGIYVSYETSGSTKNDLGIEQIYITRIVTDGQMTISIIESTYAQLLDYKKSLIDNGS